MSDSVLLEGKEYISSRRASKLSDYTQDYIGQLARKDLIDAKRVGGHWYVVMDSLEAYKSKAAAYKPEPPRPLYQASTEPDSMIAFDGKQYVSAARAAKNTGYHQDYVGQLARSGKVVSRQIGNRWYVDREAIESHKEEKDRLLGAVQAESAGIAHSSAQDAQENTEQPFFTYTTEDTKDLRPFLGDQNESATKEEIPEATMDESQAYRIPIKVVSVASKSQIPLEAVHKPPLTTKTHTGIFNRFAIAGLALTFVIVLTLGFTSLKTSSVYSLGPKAMSELASSGSVGGLLRDFTEWIESLLASNLSYTRAQ